MLITGVHLGIENVRLRNVAEASRDLGKSTSSRYPAVLSRLIRPVIFRPAVGELKNPMPDRRDA